MTQLVADITLRPFVVKAKVESDEKNVPAGYRLVTVSWKQTDAMTKAGKTARSACSTIVPIVTVSVTPDILAVALNACIAEIQDKMVAETVNAAIKEDSSIQWSAINLDPTNYTMQGIADWYAAQAEKGKLSKEAIGNWFDTMLRKPLESAFAQQVSDDAILAAILKSHRDNLLSLASPQVKMPEKLVKQLQRALKLVETEDKIKLGMNARLTAFIKPPVEAMEYALPDTDC
jgi:hypothetical protein